MNVADQITRAVDLYARSVPQGLKGEEQRNAIRGAYLSGISQMAEFMAKLDGDPSATPSKITEAVNVVARRLGMEPESPR